MNGLVHCWCTYHENKEEGHTDGLYAMYHKPENHVELMKNKNDPNVKRRITSYESGKYIVPLVGSSHKARQLMQIPRCLWHASSSKC